MQVGSVVAIFLCALALIVSSQPWDGRYKKLDVNDEKIKELANKAVEKSNEKSQFPSWHALKEIVSAKVQVGGTQNTVLELNLHPTNCKNEVPKPKTECEMMKNTIGQLCMVSIPQSQDEIRVVGCVPENAVELLKKKVEAKTKQ